MGVTAWAKTGPSGPKYQVNFGDQVSYLKGEDSLFEPPSLRWPNKSSISRNGDWSCLKCIAIMQTSKKRSRSLFKPFGRKWNQIWSLWQKKRPIMERSSKLLSENFGLWSMKLKRSKLNLPRALVPLTLLI